MYIQQKSMLSIIFILFCLLNSYFADYNIGLNSDNCKETMEEIRELNEAIGRSIFFKFQPFKTNFLWIPIYLDYYNTEKYGNLINSIRKDMNLDENEYILKINTLAYVKFTTSTLILDQNSVIFKNIFNNIDNINDIKDEKVYKSILSIKDYIQDVIIMPYKYNLKDYEFIYKLICYTNMRKITIIIYKKKNIFTYNMF